MRHTINLDSTPPTLVVGVDDTSEVESITGKRATGAPMEVQFVSDNVPVLLPDGTVLSFIGKTTGKFDEDPPLVFFDGFVAPADPLTGYYTGSPSFNTTGLNDLLLSPDGNANNDVASVTIMGAFSWQLGGDEPTETKTFEIIVDNKVYNGNEAAASEAGPALNTRLSALELVGSLRTGKMLHVSATYGNDTTAARERAGKPFLTIAAAKAAALSGDTIFVGPGVYNERDLLKTGVNLHFELGAVINYTGSTPGAIFADTGGVVVMLTGWGRFLHAGVPATGCHVFKITHPDTVIYAQMMGGRVDDAAVSITPTFITQDAGVAQWEIYDEIVSASYDVIVHNGGVSHLKARKVSAIGATSGSGIEAAGGTLTVDIDHLSSVSEAAIDMVDGTLLGRIGTITSATDSPCISHDFGHTELTCERMISGRPIYHSGGFLRVSGAVVDSTASATGNPVTVAGAGLILHGCILKAHSTRDSISAPSAHTVVSLASYANKAVDADVTIDGSLVVGTYVQ